MRLLLLAWVSTLAAASQFNVAPSLRFEPNVGQTDSRAQFIARSSRYNVFLTGSGAVLAPHHSAEGVKIRFVDSKPANLEGLSPMAGVVSYFHGAQRFNNVSTYERVQQRALYPGIDIVYHGQVAERETEQLEYDFIVAPGADPSHIVIAFDGARAVRLNDRGEIELSTAAGTLTQRRPVLWQEREGKRIPIEGQYQSRGNGEFALVVAKYDRNLLLIIDPSLVFYNSIGGSGGNQVNGIALDSQGNIIIAGQTASIDFPVVGGVQRQLPVAYAYRLDQGQTAPTRLTGVLNSVTALAADPKSPSTVYAGTLNGLLKSTDSGSTWKTIGSGLPLGPFASSIVIDPSNPQVIYAALQNVFSSTENGQGMFKSTDAGASWTAINKGLTGTYATFIQIDVIDPFDSSHLLILTGAGPYQTTNGGADWSPSSFNYDSIAFDPNNRGVVYATAPVGGIETVFKSTDGGATWKTISSVGGAAFSLIVDPHNSSTLYAGAAAGLFKSTDSGVTWSPLKVPDNTAVAQLADDPLHPNTLYVRFYTSLYKTTDGGVTFFPLAANLQVQNFAVSSDAATIYLATQSASNVFVTKFDPTGKTILYSTYIGGSVADQTAGLAIDSQDNVYVTGLTYSPDFPVTPHAVKSSGGGPGFVATPGFVFKLNPAGNKLIYSATIDGAIPAAIAVDAAGDAYVTGASQGGLDITKGAYWAKEPMCVEAFFSCIPQADGFVFKLPPSGTSLIFSTYLNQLSTQFNSNPGGDQIARAIALDSAGNAYITGSSRLVDKLSADGSSLLYSTALSSTALGSIGEAITLDSSNNAYVTGSGALITKFDPNGQELFSKTMGDPNSDTGKGIAIDSSGNIVIAGETLSPRFPLLSPTQGMFSPETGFLTKLDGSASKLLFSTYVGDAQPFQLSGLALDSAGRALTCGTALTTSQYWTSGLSTSLAAFISEYEMSDIPSVRLDNVLNAASQQGGALAVGEIVTVLGAGFGTKDSTQLLFDQKPATLISATPTSLTAIVPYALDGKTSTVVQVQSGGALSNPVPFAVAPVAPGIYSVDGTGTGQALAFNEDGTRNSLSNPAAVGSTITFYATGIGQTIPPGVDGVLHRSGPVPPAHEVSVYIGFSYISGPQYSVGPAPGFPADVMTIQAVVPSPPSGSNIVLPGMEGVQILIDGVFSQTSFDNGPGYVNVNIAVKQK